MILVLIVAVLGSLFAFGNREKTKERETENTTTADYNYEVSIDNMTCALCDVAVEKQLTKLDWIQSVKGDHTTGLALFRIDNPLDTAEMTSIINAELEKIGYHFVELRKLPNG